MSVIRIAVAAVSLLGLAFGTILGYVSRRFAVEDGPVVEKINEVLPQNQCGQCGYPGCHSCTEAISYNDEKISRCTPGGEAVMLKAAELFNVESQPPGGEAQEITPARMVAAIGGNNCIGCTKCIQACPVNATIGATRAIHTVINNLCMSHNLRIDPYPTYCISLQPVIETPDSWRWDLNIIPMCIIPVERHA